MPDRAEAHASPRSPNILEIGDIKHSYNGVPALRGVSLSVAKGEFLTLLGPSGSGKSTLLRVIAGLEEPESAGCLRLDGRDILALPANLRNVSTVFQHFALFPHMTVGENVEYSLKIRKVPRQRRRAEADKALALVRLRDKYERRIHQLSGGERQRVALARSLVMGPDILLLDEPLGALDERLRLDMQIELIELRRKTGGTFILVTHSQEEAITMSDRVVLMNNGAIEQIGSPRELFSSPQTEFAARFMGVENVLPATLESLDADGAEVRIGGRRVRGRPVGERRRLAHGGAVFAAIRAENLRVGNPAPGANAVRGSFGEAIYKGRVCDLPFQSELGDLIVRVPADAPPPAGACDVSFLPEHCVVSAPGRTSVN